MAAASQPNRQNAGPAKAAGLPLNFGDYLASGVHEVGKRKGERTRGRLKAATARLLESGGYRDLRVTDVNEAAGVSNALFYVYFQNKEVIAKEVLTEFLQYLDTFRERDPRSSDIIESIHISNTRYAQIFSANKGLMRCLFQFADEFPEFAAEWRSWNSRWWNRAMRAFSRAGTVAFDNAEDLQLALAALGAMVDGLLRTALIERTPGLMRDGEDEIQRLAGMLTRLWVRALFISDVDPSKIAAS